jgi:hypothetical protein
MLLRVISSLRYWINSLASNIRRKREQSRDTRSRNPSAQVSNCCRLFARLSAHLSCPRPSKTLIKVLGPIFDQLFASVPRRVRLARTMWRERLSDDSAFLEFRDVVPREAKIEQHRLGVLALFGCPRGPRGLLVELPRAM